MARSIRVRFSHGVINPLEKVMFSEGAEFTAVVHEAPKESKRRQVDKISQDFADNVRKEIRKRFPLGLNVMKEGIEL